uniref:Uncharacterized protein n=1 Tax=Pararge aegeria TaxID=116150 RepID=S4PXM0_9NEOP
MNLKRAHTGCPSKIQLSFLLKRRPVPNGSYGVICHPLQNCNVDTATVSMTFLYQMKSNSDYRTRIKYDS